MDSFSRALNFAAVENHIKFRPLCKDLKLVNPLFAGNLTLVYKVHIPTIQIIMKAFQHFSNTTGT